MVAALVAAAAVCLIFGGCGGSGAPAPADLPPVDDHDIAVWEGPQPATNKEAAGDFDALYNRYLDGRAAVLPTKRIAAYVRALLARYPDLTTLPDSTVDDSPWGDGPLIGDASGPVLFFEIVGNAAGRHALGFAAKVAHEQGLVYYDDTIGQLADG